MGTQLGLPSSPPSPDFCKAKHAWTTKPPSPALSVESRPDSGFVDEPHWARRPSSESVHSPTASTWSHCPSRTNTLSQTRRKPCPHGVIGSSEAGLLTTSSNSRIPETRRGYSLRSTEPPGIARLHESRIFLQAHGYRLLSEVKVDDPRHFLFDTLDAVRIEDGQLVTLKSVLLTCDTTFTLHDFSQLKDVASLETIAAHRTNSRTNTPVTDHGDSQKSLPALDHRLPVQQVLSQPRFPNFAFLVYPHLQIFEPLSDIKTTDDLACFVIQLLEGLAFLHRQGTCHGALSRQTLTRTSNNITHSPLGQSAPMYYFAPTRRERRIKKQTGSISTHDDIYQLGKLLQWNILNRFAGHRRLASLVNTMLDPVPQRRPSADAALRQYTQPVARYTVQKLNRPIEMRALEGIAPDSFDFLRLEKQCSLFSSGRRLARLVLDFFPSPGIPHFKSTGRRPSRPLPNYSASSPPSPSIALKSSSLHLPKRGRDHQLVRNLSLSYPHSPPPPYNNPPSPNIPEFGARSHFLYAIQPPNIHPSGEEYTSKPPTSYNVSLHSTVHRPPIPPRADLHPTQRRYSLSDPRYAHAGQLTPRSNQGHVRSRSSPSALLRQHQ